MIFDWPGSLDIRRTYTHSHTRQTAPKRSKRLHPCSPTVLTDRAAHHRACGLGVSMREFGQAVVAFRASLCVPHLHARRTRPEKHNINEDKKTRRQKRRLLIGFTLCMSSYPTLFQQSDTCATLEVRVTSHVFPSFCVPLVSHFLGRLSQYYNASLRKFRPVVADKKKLHSKAHGCSTTKIKSKSKKQNQNSSSERSSSGKAEV